MPVRLGFIGAGGIASAHLRALASMPEAKVVSVCDVDRARASAAADPLGASIHIHYRAMIDTEELDAVYICVPPFAHGEAESAAAEAGLHMFIEKPIGLSVAKAKETLRAIEQSGVITSVGYHWRYHSVTDLAKQALADRPIVMLRGQWIGGMPGVDWWRVREKSGGQAVEQTTHIFDLARYFAGDVRSVYALGYQGILAPKVPHYNVEDASLALLRFADDAIGSMASADICRLGRGSTAMLAIICEDFSVDISSEGLDILEKGKRTHVDVEGRAQERESSVFLQAVQTGDRSDIRSPYADALKTLATTLAANESMESGKVVDVR